MLDRTDAEHLSRETEDGAASDAGTAEIIGDRAIFRTLGVNDRGAGSEAYNDRFVELRKIKTADARACKF